MRILRFRVCVSCSLTIPVGLYLSRLKVVGLRGFSIGFCECPCGGSAFGSVGFGVRGLRIWHDLAFEALGLARGIPGIRCAG